MSANSRVVTAIREVAEEQGFELPALHDDLPLHEIGLDSLAFTVVMTRLEDDFGVDPFAGEADFPLTVGEFVRIYENDRA